MIIKPKTKNAHFKFKATPKIPTKQEGIKQFYRDLHGDDFWEVSCQERTRRQNA